MLRMSLAAFTVLFCCALAQAAETEKTSPHGYLINGAGTLTLNIPADWAVHSLPSHAGGVLNIELSTKEQVGPFSVQLTAAAIPPQKKDALAPEQLKKICEITGQQYVATSKEGKIEPVELKGMSTNGYYYTLTDGSANPGRFKVVTGATLVAGDALIAVTILHQPDSQAQKLAPQMLKDASLTPATTQPTTVPASSLRLASPGDKWDLVLNTELFDDPQKETRPDGKARQFAAINDAGWMMTVYIEPAVNAGDATAVRQFYWTKMKQSPIPMKDVKLTGDASAARVEYTVPDADQKNFNLYLSHGGFWVDLHISKMQYKEAQDRAAVEELLKSAKFEPHSAAP